MLDLDPNRDGPAPKDAATLVLLRPLARTSEPGFEVFCVERNKKSRFLGGAIVFPGGRLEDSDRDAAWNDLVTEPRDSNVLRAHGVAACRESLEEAALLLVDRPVADADVLALREKQAADTGALRAFLADRGLRLDLGALHPLSHWVTPKVESRRYDTRFYLAVAPPGQTGAHDMSETMASFWASPREVLARFDRAEIQLAPPTHRTLSLLAEHESAEAALRATEGARLDPICPELVPYDGTVALVLPGDPDHSVGERRIAGSSRYVLRDERWRAEDKR